MAAPRVDNPLTACQLRTLLDYHPETGAFFWHPRPAITQYDRAWNTRYAGKLAGSSNAKGYIRIMADGRMHFAHRLAYLWMTGAWPLAGIDHKDRNQANNVWTNLRSASASQNRTNSILRSDNTSGYKGVTFDKRRQLWHARAGIDGRKHHLGYFATPEAAHAAYCEAAIRFHGEFHHTT